LFYQKHLDKLLDKIMKQ